MVTPPTGRPGLPGRLLHLALVCTDLLGRLPPLLLAPVWLGLAFVAGQSWADLHTSATLVTLAFTVVDGIGLSLLPRAGRSFGPPSPPLLALALGRAGLTWGIGGLRATGTTLWAVLVLQLVIAGLFLYATWLEPFRLSLTVVQHRSAKLNGSPPLRLLHITDLHIERITRRERELIHLVERLAPDVTVLTGDYLNLSFVRDAQAQAETRELLAAVCQLTCGPVYAVSGSPPVDVPDVVPAIFEDLPIDWLQDRIEVTSIAGQTVRIVGLRCTGGHHQDGPRLRHLLAGHTQETFTVLLYHTPDLMPEATALGIDLYLCGHTHGGQIRLPVFGAVITSSTFWKRYEMGQYVEDETTLYVNRGVGLEGMGAPRARFLAPPEVVLWTVSGNPIEEVTEAPPGWESLGG